MKKLIALLSVFLLLVTMMPVVSADDKYNDTDINWDPHTVHVYDDCADLSCNVCGALRSAGHVYDHGCDPDCNYCGIVRPLEGHEYDHNCDADCNECGALREIRHIYVDCYDETCNLCGDIREVIGHVFDNDCDPNCNSCDYKRETDHNFSEGSCTDTIVCSKCGETRTLQHDFTTANCTEPATCTICGAIQGTAPGHIYANDCDNTCDTCGEVRDAGHSFTEATCTEPSVCTACGEVGTEALGHQFVSTICTVCGMIQPVYVGGVELKDGEYLPVGSTTVTTEKPEGGYAYFKDAMLTLHNYSYTGSGVPMGDGKVAIYRDGILGIALEGDNVITITDQTAETAAIGVVGVCVIITESDPNATLTVAADYGIYAVEHTEYGCMVELANITLDVTANKCGILANGNGSVTIENCELEINADDHVMEAVNGIAIIPADGQEILAATEIGGERVSFASADVTTYKWMRIHAHVYDDDTDATCNTCGEQRYEEPEIPVAPESDFEYVINNGKATITRYIGAGGDVVIPSTLGGYPVTSIGHQAFRNCTSLTSVTIPDSVTSIENYAFYNCDNLTTVTIGDNVTSIGGSAFRGCDRLTSVTIGDSVTTIGERAFYNCASLTLIDVAQDNTNYCSLDGVLFSKDKTILMQCPGGKSGAYTIPDSVTAIGEYAFSDCTSLTSVTIPDSVTTIGYEAFLYCDSLTSVTIGDSVTTIGEWAFSLCSNLTSVTIPDSVTTIGEWAFYECTSLTAVTIGDSVTSIGGFAFDSCTSLTDVYITDLVAWCGINFYSFGSNPLYYAHNLYLNGELVTELTIPDSVTTIGNYAFYSCDSLTSVTIPDSVTTIGERAFSYCASLTKVTILDSVTTIGYEAFYDCTSLTDVYYNGTSADRENITIGEYNDNLLNATWHYSEPETPVAPESDFEYVVNDGEASITGYTGTVGDITIPSMLGGYSVTAIGEAAFELCRNLTSVIIPDSVTNIGYAAFFSCTSLTSVTIPNSVTTIGENAFYNCSSLTLIDVAQDNTNYCSLDGVLFSKDKTILIKCPGGKSGVYIIPDSVTTIDNWAFEYCASLTKVTILDSVTTIGNYAFRGCFNLTSVSIGDRVTSIGTGAFGLCSNLTSVTIPDNVTIIGDIAFYECTSLITVTIPDSVTTIGNAAFHYCSSLTLIDVAQDNTNYCSLDGVLFSKDKTILIKCPGGKSGAYTIPDSVTTIGEYAFFDCDSLTSVTIPDSVTTIGDSAFYNCDNLTDVYYNGTQADRENISFGVYNYNLLNATWHYKECEHTWTPATCTTPKTCSVCGATEGEAKGHNYFDVSIAPNCTTGGKTTHTCLICKHSYEDSYTKALGHTYKTVTVKATPTANGYTVKRCSVCKAETGKKTLYKVTSFTLSKTSYTYNGKVQKPTVTVKNSAGTKLTEGTSYTVSYASGLKNAGTYKVTITLKGNYSGTKTLTYKINPANVSTCKVTLSKTSYTYNGKVQKPTVTVKNAAGTKLTNGGSYTVTYASGLKAAGTYKVTVKMKGNYTGTKTLTYKINPINVSKCKITLSATSYTYDGKVKKPTVTVKNASGTKLSTASYTVTYASGRKNVGTYKVTIKMKGNYTGTKTLTFKINPAKTTLSSLTAGAKKLTVKWAKKTTQVTGYEIQYSTSKSFKSVKTKTITKNSTTSTALTGLKAKTTYYVRVRTYKTVNGVKYYSGWTTVKYKKTK